MAYKYQTCPHCLTVTRRPYDKLTDTHSMRRQCPACGASYKRDEKDRRIVRWVCPACSTPVDPFALSLLHDRITIPCSHCGHALPPAKKVRVEDRLQQKLNTVIEA